MPGRACSPFIVRPPAPADPTGCGLRGPGARIIGGGGGGGGGCGGGPARRAYLSPLPQTRIQPTRPASAPLPTRPRPRLAVPPGALDDAEFDSDEDILASIGLRHPSCDGSRQHGASVSASLDRSCAEVAATAGLPSETGLEPVTLTATAVAAENHVRHEQHLDYVQHETAAPRPSVLRPANSHRRHPAQLHVDALNLPEHFSHGVYARLTLHGNTMDTTNSLNSQNPMFASPFLISPPQPTRPKPARRDPVELLRFPTGNPGTSCGRTRAYSYSQPDRYAEPPRPAPAPVALQVRVTPPDPVNKMYVVHLHSKVHGEVPFASIPVPLRDLVQSPGNRLLLPVFPAGSSLGSAVTVSSTPDTAAVKVSPPTTTRALQSSAISTINPSIDTATDTATVDEAPEPAYVGFIYEPLAPGGEQFVRARSLQLVVEVSALRRRGKFLRNRVALVIAVYRQTRPAPPTRPRFVLVALSAPASRPAQRRGRYVHLQPTTIPYALLCNGDPHIPIRFAIHRVDQADTDRFRPVGFHQTSVAELEEAVLCGGHPQNLQGTYFDETVGTIRIIAAPALKSDPRRLLVAMQVDLANTRTLISATARPGVPDMSHTANSAVPQLQSLGKGSTPKYISPRSDHPRPLRLAEFDQKVVPTRLGGSHSDSDDAYGGNGLGMMNNGCIGAKGTPPGTHIQQDAQGDISSGTLFKLEVGHEKLWADRERTARNHVYL